MPLAFYLAADSKRRAAILWDLHEEEKEIYFEQLPRTSAIIRCAWLNDAPLALAWGQPTCPGGGTLGLHFMFCRPATREQALYCGVEFLRVCARLHELAICVIPTAWRGARVFAESLGFESKLSLPGACWLDKWSRAASGQLMALDLAAYRMGRSNGRV